MLKIEKCVVPSPEQWEIIIEATRNPKNSWHLMDSGLFLSDNYEGAVEIFEWKIGPNDEKLMKSLAKGGPVHAKYRRMIPVFVTLSAPVYWWPEMDAYKVGTVRNSCSFMHKGLAKPFEITDFSITDERIYEVLTPLRKKTYELVYPYETDDYRIYTHHDGKTYRVYRNGLVIREGFSYTDTYKNGRTRVYPDSEATLYKMNDGYYCVKFAGRNGGHMLLHRLIASLWCECPEGATQVNHKDGNKGNNSAENLEWVTASENMKHAISLGLYASNNSLHKRYKLWKYSSHVIPIEHRWEFTMDVNHGLSGKELARKWNITETQANNMKHVINNSEHEELFQHCYVWDKVLECLNYLRCLYLETKDEKIFQAIRCLLPSGYLQKSTILLNYEVLHNIYFSRKDHRLEEWHTFCDWIETLPYSELITTPMKNSNIEIEDAIKVLQDAGYYVMTLKNDLNCCICANKDKECDKCNGNSHFLDLSEPQEVSE